MKEVKISPSHRRFVYEYLKDLNGSAAWIRSGHSCSENVARASAARVLANVNVKALVRQHLEDQAAAANLTVDKILREYMRLGFSDIRNVTNWENGVLTLTDSADLTPEVTSSIAQITQTTKRYRDTEEITLTVKLHPKTAALDALGKHLMMFQDVTVNNDLQVNVSISDLAKLVHGGDSSAGGDEARTIAGEVAAE